MKKLSVKELLYIYSDLKRMREPYISTLEEAARLSWPNAQDMMLEGTPDTNMVKTVEILDSIGIRSSYKMTAGIYTNLMPNGTEWFIFRPSDKSLNNDKEVIKGLSYATEITLSEIGRSNFQREMFSTIRSMVVLGTGCISVVMTDTGDLYFKSHNIKDIFFDIDSLGRIDTVYHRLWYTPRQAQQEFPDMPLGKTVEEALKDKNQRNKKFEFVHCIYPRKDYNPKLVLSKESKKYVSKYINVEDEVIVKDDKGFNYLPYMIGRFDKTQDELMGTSPGIDMIPEIRELIEMKRDYTLASALNVLPPMMMEDDGVVGQPTTEPNSAMYIRPGALYPQPYKTGGNSESAYRDLEAQRQVIRDGYFTGIFQVLENRKNLSSAREVDQLAADSFSMLAPFVGGINKELSDPLISAVFNLLVENKIIDDSILGDINIDIVYQGRLAVAMSAMQANAIEVTLSKWSPLESIHPVLDNFDLDGSAVDSAIAAGYPAARIRSDEEVKQIRDARNQEAQQAQQAELADKMSKAYKNTSVAAQPDSLAETIGEMI